MPFEIEAEVCAQPAQQRGVIMAKALLGHIGAASDRRLVDEVHRLRAKVHTLEFENARLRAENDRLKAARDADGDAAVRLATLEEPVLT